MNKIFFQNDICTCEIADDVFEDELCIHIMLTKPYNQLQIEERNSVTIAMHESEIELRKYDVFKFAVEFTNFEDHITIAGWKEED